METFIGGRGKTVIDYVMENSGGKNKGDEDKMENRLRLSAIRITIKGKDRWEARNRIGRRCGRGR